MCTNVIDYPCELTTYGKSFFTLVVKTTHVRLDHVESLYHMYYIFLCMCSKWGPTAHIVHFSYPQSTG